MNQAHIHVIEQCARASHEGSESFAAIVGRLIAAGVESYQADYRRQFTTYYLPTGEQHEVALPVPVVDIPSPFDASALQAAIKGSQRGEVMYPEFLRRSMQAGCVGYVVWISGRHVSYFGRLGEQHLERFPSQ